MQFNTEAVMQFNTEAFSAFEKKTKKRKRISNNTPPTN